ncbi:MAG: AEC family transporter [Nocardioidaceae bacterium]
MGGVLEGFAVIGVVIGLGFVLAHIGVVGADSQVLLSRLVFFVASPALLFTLLGDVDPVAVLSSNLTVAVTSLAATAALAAGLARYAWRMDLGDAVIATLCGAYANAGNLGIPIAVYALGDASAVASLMLFQLLIVSPTAFVLLDRANRGRRMSPSMVVRLIVRNPITVGSLLGLLVAIAEWTPPEVVVAPIELVAGMAVPGMLIAYGVSLRLGPRPGRGAPVSQVATVAALKLVVQPGIAYAVGAFVLGLEPEALLAVTVVAALPTAQNIFVYAVRYDRSSILARDSIFVSTILSVPVVLLIAALLA